MNVQKFKKNKKLTYAGCAIEFAAWFLILICTIVGLPSDIYYFSVLVISLALMAAGCCLIIVADIKTKNCRVLNIKAVYVNAEKYSSLPYCEITDYGNELEIIRANYAADLNQNKNKINEKLIRKDLFYKKRNTPTEKFLDFNVLKTGKIYYGYYVESFNDLHAPFSCNKYGIIKVLYSTEENFSNNPEKLKIFYDRLYDYNEDGCEGFKVLSNPFIFNFKIPKKISDGHEIYLTSIIAERRQLPIGYISNNILPVIASPKTSTSSFIIESMYWSEKFIGNFAYKNDKNKYIEYNLQKISGFTEKRCPDYAAELEHIRKKFVADIENTPIDLLGDNPFPSFEHVNTKFYYAYVLNTNNKKREGEPYVGLFSADEHFKSNPKEYKDVAEKLQNNQNERKKISQVLNLRTHGIQTFRLPYDLTDGYNVMLTAIFINMEKLPTLSITSPIVPVACYTEKIDNWLYSVDSKYWSKEFIYEFVYATV